MRDFLDMGGYALYVWSSIGLTFVVLAANLYAARARHRRVCQQLLRRLRSEDK
jgi:heme exporter protein D